MSAREKKELTEIQRKGIMRRLAMFHARQRAREEREARGRSSVSGSSARQAGRAFRPAKWEIPVLWGRRDDSDVLFLGCHIQDGDRGPAEPVPVAVIVKQLFFEAGIGRDELRLEEVGS